MESLALLVAIIFFTMIFCGPAAYALTFILPVWLGKFFCFLALLVGIWWLCLPIGGARLFAMLTIFLALRGLLK